MVRILNSTNGVPSGVRPQGIRVRIVVPAKGSSKKRGGDVVRIHREPRARGWCRFIQRPDARPAEPASGRLGYMSRSTPFERERGRVRGLSPASGAAARSGSREMSLPFCWERSSTWN